MIKKGAIFTFDILSGSPDDTNHSEIARGTLRVIIKDAGLTVEKF